jgi:hypothetical protein
MVPSELLKPSLQPMPALPKGDVEAAEIIGHGIDIAAPLSVIASVIGSSLSIPQPHLCRDG